MPFGYRAFYHSNRKLDVRMKHWILPKDKSFGKIWSRRRSNTGLNMLSCWRFNLPSETISWLFKAWMNNRPFDERNVLDHLNSKLVCYSDSHCILHIYSERRFPYRFRRSLVFPPGMKHLTISKLATKLDR